MQSLNKQSESIFKDLLTSLSARDCTKLLSEGYMPLSIERIGRLNSSLGSGNAYSMMHSFTQNGDLMRDPEMCFWFLETAIDPAWIGKIFPYSYQLDCFGIYEESITFRSNGFMEIDLKVQKQHASFANSWLHNISSQGFLK